MIIFTSTCSDFDYDQNKIDEERCFYQFASFVTPRPNANNQNFIIDNRQKRTAYKFVTELIAHN